MKRFARIVDRRWGWIKAVGPSLVAAGAILAAAAGCVSEERAVARRPAPAPTPVEPAPAPVPAAVPAPAPVADFERIGDQTLRLRLATGIRQLTVGCGGVLEVESGPAPQQWIPGSYTLRLTGGAPAPRQFHLFVKTFPGDRPDEARVYADEWRRQGYPAEVVALGKRFRAEDGSLLDNRVHYVSLTRFPARAQAEAEKARLEKLGQWSWVEEEAVAPGAGQVAVSGGGRPPASYATPLALRGQAPLSVTLGGGRAGTYSGAIEIEVGPDGLLTIFERIPLEDYLAGVLPAEMPASWPVEALKAQAIAARSEVLANLGVKHKLEGFNYCAAEHCRAYNGFGGRKPASDAAVAETAGLGLAGDARLIPTVFSACCGGWTEHNDNVWSSPPDASLRGTADAPPGAAPPPAATPALAQWLRRPSTAFCSADSANFRWVRRYTASELTALVNKAYAVGTVRDVRLGERGVSGRLKSLDVVGLKQTVTIRKELPIRQAFGGLPSALFILDVERGPNGPKAFVFTGAGRGHGVGLCQQGARGMAVHGWRCGDILAHYYAGTRVVRLE